MRHYEILGNYCMPHFQDLQNCPVQTMFNFPKKKFLKEMLFLKAERLMIDIMNF